MGKNGPYIPERDIVNVVIFSRDRAMQLDATLRSFYLHALNSQLAEVTVLCHATSELVRKQYLQLEQEHKSTKFIAQEDFRNDLLNILNPFGENEPPLYNIFRRFTSFIYRTRSRVLLQIFLRTFGRLITTLAPAAPANHYWLFLVDDSILVSDFQIASVVKSLRQNPSALGFSLRLGKNTNYCYMMDSNQVLPEFTQALENILLYKWESANLDFAYPLEVSSSAYRAKDLLGLILGLPFANPNELERRMAVRAHYFRRKRPDLLCFDRSVAFSNPLNIVQKVYLKNRVSSKPEFSSDELFHRFDRGERIQVEALNGFVPKGCHQVVDLVFFKHQG